MELKGCEKCMSLRSVDLMEQAASRHRVYIIDQLVEIKGDGAHG